MPRTIFLIVSPRRRVNRLLPFLIALAGLALAIVPVNAGAQSIFDKIKEKAKEKIKAEEDTLSTTVVDKATGAVVCVVTNEECISDALNSDKNVKIVDKNGTQVSASDSSKAVAKTGITPTATPTVAPTTTAVTPTSTAPGNDVFLNYDFLPGDRVLFAEDFTRDNPGDFPRRLQLKSGNFEVADWNGQKFLRTNDAGTVLVPLPEILPQRFTFEADYSGGGGWDLKINFADAASTDLTAALFNPKSGGLLGAGVNSSSDISDAAAKPLTHIAVMADGNYVKTYVNGVRVANVPNANLGRAKAISITFTADQSTPAYMTNIRVAAGGKQLYDAIMADGRVATHGILFATGSDVIRGESKPTLDQIGQMLQQHADLKLTIEGHTDNVGSAMSNQTLSDQRAAAVKQYLVANYQVDASRLASKGMGATKPAASNDTPEGRQQNRRVELVKM